MVNLPILSLFLTFALIGCYSMAVQVLFIREFIVVFLGNELCLGITFASWLIGISLGAGLGARIIEKVKEVFHVFMTFQLIICVSPLFQIYLIRTIRESLHIPPGEYISLIPLVMSTFLLILPFSFLIGIIFPFSCRLASGTIKGQAQTIGWVYIVEAVGSFAGGILLTFYLIPHLKPYETLTSISLLFVLNGITLCLLNQNKLTRVIMIFFLVITLPLAFLFFSGKSGHLDNFLVKKRWDAYHNHLELIASLNSPYQNIVVAEKEGQYSLFSNGQYVLSFPDPYQSAVYTHFVLSQHPHPQKILLVGGGITGIIQETLKYPILSLSYVELDPKLIEASLPFLSPEDSNTLKDDRVKVFYADGRHYIKNTQEKYDMVILNLPDPSTAMINRFYTREFFKEVKERLNEGGIVVTGITSAVTYVGEEVGFYAGSIYNTLKKVFPFIIIAPGEKNYFFASSSPHILTTDTKILGQRFRSRHILSEYFTPYHFEMLFPEEQVTFIKHSLEKKSGLKINTDFQPITYFYNLVLWQIFSGEKGEGNIFKHLSDRFTWYAIPLLILFFIRVVYVLFSRQRLPHHLKFNSLLAITTTGFAGMALEIILMFSFQNIYGYIYQKVGLIVALFMLGLSLGGYCMNLLIEGRERNWVKILITIQFLICLYSITLPFIIKFVSSHTGSSIIAPGLEYLFMLLVAGAGWLTGLEFPLVSRIVITQEEVGTVAGWVDAFDHLGACFGALLTGTLLVPLLGTFNSCFITGILSLMSGLLLTIYLIQKRG